MQPSQDDGDVVRTWGLIIPMQPPQDDGDVVRT